MNDIPLAQRDMRLSQIENEIKNKKMLLVQKRKDLDKKEKLNEYLSGVKTDYNNYYDYIVKEKQQQMNTLNLLKEYLDDLVQTENLVDRQLKTVRRDQKDILGEISNIRNELDNIVEDNGDDEDDGDNMV
jgi:ribosome biogenesis GTPase A